MISVKTKAQNFGAQGGLPLRVEIAHKMSFSRKRFWPSLAAFVREIAQISNAICPTRPSKHSGPPSEL
jgi:hypothetical protein